MLHLTGVHAHPDQQRARRIPRLCAEGTLRVDRGLDRIVDRAERSVEPISAGLDHLSPVGLDRRAHDLVMTSQRVPHRVRVLLP